MAIRTWAAECRRVSRFHWTAVYFYTDTEGSQGTGLIVITDEAFTLRGLERKVRKSLRKLNRSQGSWIVYE